MLTKLAYAYYEAGGAVAAIHLKLSIRQVSINPARGSTDILIPKESGKGEKNPKTRITLWLASMAAEKKGVGETDALRRMKNRQRIRAELEEWEKNKSPKTNARQKPGQKSESAILSQAQDRANAICASLFPAIEKLAQRLAAEEVLSGDQVEKIVAEFRKHRSLGSTESD